MPEKKHYVLKLIPPRPTFATDMTETERAVMMEHVAYWKDLLDKGIVIVYGPVADPKGTYGIGIVGVDDDKQLNTLTSNDPALKLGNKYDIAPMVRAIMRS